MSDSIKKPSFFNLLKLSNESNTAAISGKNAAQDLTRDPAITSAEVVASAQAQSGFKLFSHIANKTLATTQEFPIISSDASIIDRAENVPNSIKILTLLLASGKCNRREFSLAYTNQYGVSQSLALSEIGKLERSGKIIVDNPEPDKQQSKMRMIEISESGKMELSNPSYLKTKVFSAAFPAAVNLTSGLLALLHDMSTHGAVKYTDYMLAAGKQYGHTQLRTTLSGRITNLRVQSGYVEMICDSEGNKLIYLTEKGLNKLNSVRAQQQTVTDDPIRRPRP